MNDRHEDWIYVWEEGLFDEDGQLWIVTMMSIMILPLYEELRIRPVLLNLMDY